MSTRFAGAVPMPAELRDGYVADRLWGDVGLRDAVEATARIAPDRVAVIDENATWSYGRLEAAIARAVAALMRHGVGRGTAVLVVAPLLAPSVVAYHAIVRTGGVAVMLDRRCGRTDVLHAVALADARAVVAPPALAAHLDLASLGLPLLSFDDLVDFPEESRDWPEPDADQPAAIVFTSGTTNRPKGVVHSLNTLRAGARNMANAMALVGDDVAFLSSPIASITGLMQAHVMLDRGATLVLEDHFDAVRSLDRLLAHGVTVLGGAPVILEQLLTQAQARDLPRLPLRVIALGGAMIPRPLLELAVTRYQITPVRIYGSSEVPCATATPASDEGEARIGDDGACPPGTQLRTDGDVPGELLVRGPMRCLGYLDAQDNRDAFAEGGWYRTGDLARIEHGRLTVTGRLKEIVSRKGLKISLAEIDEVAAGLPGVEEVAAFAVPDAETGERLAIAVYARQPDAIDFDHTVDHLLAAGLAKWKLPEQIVVWDAPLPRTATGKIQRRRLADDPGARRTLLAPRLRSVLTDEGRGHPPSS